MKKLSRGGFVRRISVRTRLVLAFGALIVLLAAMAGAGAWRLAELDRRTQELATVKMPVDHLVGEWLAQSRSNLLRREMQVRSDDPQLQQLLAPELEAASTRISALQKQVEALATTPQAIALLREVGERRKQFLQVAQKVAGLKKAGDSAGASAMMDDELLPAQQRYLGAVETLRDYYSMEAVRDAEGAAQNARTGRYLLLVLCAVGIVLSLVASWLIARSITRPIDEAVRAARRVADGDLTVDLAPSGRDEMAELLLALAAMTEGLRRLVGEVARGARTVADTSAQIAQGNVDLSQRTEEQASTLEETASSMEELTATVGQNADHARQASQLADDASRVAQEGGEAVGTVVASMSAISGSSRKISEIIGVIDGIAFQTNILALNAAVEAARAGEQGRGFAVVATEVRNLAQRSAGAAKEIKALISESVQQVEAGSRQVDAAGRKMDDVVRAARKVNELIAEIAGASQEQRSGIEQVNTAVTAMDQGVQQNASLVEEAAAATESMKAQAAALHASVARFRLDDAQGDPAAEAPPPLTPGIPFSGSETSDAYMLPPAPAQASGGEWRVFQLTAGARRHAR